MHPCPVWLPSVLSPENWTGFVYTVQGVSPGDPSASYPTEACSIQILPIFQLCPLNVLPPLPRVGWGRGPIPEMSPSSHMPLTIPHAGSLKPGVFVQVLIFFFSVSSYSLSLCVLLPQLSDPKPFQGFQMTIIGEKDCAAFSFYFCFQSQRALQRPSCPPPIIPCPPLYDNQCDLLRAAAPTLTLLVLQSLPPDFSSFS